MQSRMAYCQTRHSSSIALLEKSALIGTKSCPDLPTRQPCVWPYAPDHSAIFRCEMEGSPGGVFNPTLTPQYQFLVVPDRSFTLL
jgi:hypothetical protein